MELESIIADRVPVRCLTCEQTTKVGAVAKCGICGSDNVCLIDRDERLRILEERVERLSRALSMTTDGLSMTLARVDVLERQADERAAAGGTDQ